MMLAVLELEIHPDCGKEVGIEGVVSISTKEGSFANSRGTHQHDFEYEIVVTLHDLIIILRLNQAQQP